MKNFLDEIICAAIADAPTAITVPASVGLVAVDTAFTIKNTIDDKKRKSIECTFNSGVTRDDFKRIAVDEAKKIKRLWVEVDGPVIKGTMTSRSGMSDWKFTIDFNDYGKVTGKYWIRSENEDSEFPKAFAERIKRRLV